MDLFSAIGNYIDKGVDWVAEAIGYVDDYADFDQTEYSAGDQLIDTVTGFIRKAPTPKFSRGYQTKRENPNKFKQRYKQSVSSLSRGSRSLTGVAPRKTPLKVGYLNPDVKADLTNILQNATNSQWRQLFNDYGYVSPTKQISRGSGKSEIKLKTTLKSIDKVELPKSKT